MRDVWELLLNVSSDLIASIVIFALGFLSSSVPKNLKKIKLKRFFSKSILDDKFIIVFGKLYTSLPKHYNDKEINETVDQSQFMYKIYPGDVVIKVPMMKKIITNDFVRSTTYLNKYLYQYRKKPFTVCEDINILGSDNNVRNIESDNSSFLCIGGPITNLLTDLILGEKYPNQFEISTPEDRREGNFFLKANPKGEDEIKFEKQNTTDYGLVMKVKNPWSHKDKNYLFVCAGIEGFGTSGAVNYLAQNWRELHNEFGKTQFGLIVKIELEDDSKITREYSKIIPSI